MEVNIIVASSRAKSREVSYVVFTEVPKVKEIIYAPSRRAAQRLGFSFKGIFRQITIYKSRNRDTAWYAITDKEWQNLERVDQIWKQPNNFDADERQIKKLSELTSAILVNSG